MAGDEDILNFDFKTNFMSWKIYLIIISNATNINVAEVPSKLGLNNLKPTVEVNLLEAQYKDNISVGRYEDKIIVTAKDLVYDFYQNIPTEREKRFVAAFPNSEITVLTIHSSSYLYGYSIIRNGKRIRVKHGADTEKYIDQGEKLQEEIDIRKGEIFTNEELKDMKGDYSKKELENVIDHEASFRVPFRLTKRYFGKQIDDADFEIENIKLTLFE